MDKSKERKIFNYIYSESHFLEVKDSEKPDFICTVSPTFNLGVEVTEFYTSESMARVYNIPGYVTELIDKENYCHKDDREILTVDFITIKSPDGTEDAGRGIISSMPSLPDRINQLCSLIQKKNESVFNYDRNIDALELIISDEGTSIFENIDAVLKTFYHNDKLLYLADSPFREIYLVLRRKEYIPLKANILLAEISTFETLFKKNVPNITLFRLVDYLDCLLDFLISRGFKGIKFYLINNNIQFYYSKVCFYYNKQSELKVNLIHNTELPTLKPIEQLLEGTDKYRNIIDDISKEREHFFSMVPIKCPVIADNKKDSNGITPLAHINKMF